MFTFIYHRRQCLPSKPLFYGAGKNKICNKYILIALLSFHSLFAYASDYNWKREFVQKFVLSCMDKQLSDPRTLSFMSNIEINEFCKCAGEYVVRDFDDRDMEIILQSNSYNHMRPEVNAAFDKCASRFIDNRLPQPTNSPLPAEYNTNSQSRLTPHESKRLRCSAIKHAANKDPFMSSMSASTSVVMGKTIVVVGNGLGLFGFNDFSRGLLNSSADMLDDVECYMSPKLDPGLINKSGDIPAYLLAVTGRIIGYILPFGVAYMLFIFVYAIFRKKD